MGLLGQMTFTLSYVFINVRMTLKCNVLYFTPYMPKVICVGKYCITVYFYTLDTERFKYSYIFFLILKKI